MMMTTINPIQNVINVLNTHCPNMLVVQKFMLLARIQRAAKLGDVDARHYVELCELNIEAATKQ
jgi:hypothetical protein